MLAVFLFESSRVYLFLAAVPESLLVLAFGVGLVGATAGLRWVLKRRDGKIEHGRR